MNAYKSMIVAAVLLWASAADCACPNLVDCPENRDADGIWVVGHSPEFPAVLIGLTAGAALWEGDRSRFGGTLWRSVDSAALSGIVTTGLKLAFQRKRPIQSDNPNDWFAGPRYQSFPSGDVSVTAALVTPVILEYGPTCWPVYGLAALPVYDMFARTRYKAHWTTDVLAGAVIGAGIGWFAHEMSHPLIVTVLPDGLRAGLTVRF
jgi:undecaprenyl-diphosphatase